MSLERARMLERAEVRALRQLAVIAMPIENGMMGYSSPGSHSNKVVGLGLDAPLEPETLSRVEEFYDGHRCPTRIELTSYTPRSTLEMLGRRGYALVDTGSAMFFDLSAKLPPAPQVVVTRVDPSDDAAVRQFVELAMSGFFPAGEIPESAFEMGTRGAKMSGADSFIASVGGALAGAAGCGTSEDITCLFGASVVETQRRKGVHHALISARLHRAKELGARVASVVSFPGETTERNARRMGFDLAYTRLTFVRTAS